MNVISIKEILKISVLTVGMIFNMIKPSLKKICIYSATAGVGRMVEDAIGNKEFEGSHEIVTQLSKLGRMGQLAVTGCQMKVDNSVVRRAHKKIGELYEDDTSFNILDALLFIIIGCDDLADGGCHDIHNIQMLSQAQTCLEIFDPDLDQEAAYDTAVTKFNRWVA